MSIYQELKSALPNAEYHYLMDNKFLPYGELSENELIERLFILIDAIIDIIDPSLFVIACNTASTQALTSLRERYKKPFVGVVPAIKPAAIYSTNKDISVLATPATTKGDYIKALISEFASDCKVSLYSAGDLVHIAEKHFWTEDNLLAEVEEYVKGASLNMTKSDAMVLGCTHFPLIKDYLSKVLPNDIKFIDSGAAIAKRVVSLIGNRIEEEAVYSTTSLYVTTPLTKQQKVRCQELSIKYYALN